MRQETFGVLAAGVARLNVYKEDHTKRRSVAYSHIGCTRLMSFWVVW
jgi:hypothetical protein